MTRKDVLRELLDTQAPESDRWKRKNRYYYEMIERIIRFHVPRGSSVLEIGCGTGDLLAALGPSKGTGVEISPKAVEIARVKHPTLTFHVCDVKILHLTEQSDYVILSDVIGYLDDVKRAFEQLNRVCHPSNRVVLTYFNYLWEPVLRAGEHLGVKRPQPDQNWLSLAGQKALCSGRGELVHGSRLVYPMEKQAMRFLNTLGNKFFSLAFTWLAAGRSYFGDFDPFGDFDLIFGAAKLDLKILEVPIRYRERTYETTQISRFRHGWLLLRMCLFALRRIKFV
ncbi:MAG: Methyltransferase type 12 [Deltaproteobacteria bacterium]|nr:Methyltransferase type 12 [Deltaproteobacteria bacterium]